MIFENRRQAGAMLGGAICAREGWQGAVVLAIPRGGVPVGFEVARSLGLPLDIFVVRKLGAPGQPELAIGAVASGGLVYLNEAVARAFRMERAEFDAAAARELLEIERRETLYRAGRAAIDTAGRAVILIDDGLATGSTMKAAVAALRPHTAAIGVAVPVASRGACHDLSREADWLVCLETPERFEAVGEFYRDFQETSDDEVRTLLAEAPATRPAA